MGLILFTDNEYTGYRFAHGVGYSQVFNFSYVNNIALAGYFKTAKMQNIALFRSPNPTTHHVLLLLTSCLLTTIKNYTAI